VIPWDTQDEATALVAAVLAEPVMDRLHDRALAALSKTNATGVLGLLNSYRTARCVLLTRVADCPPEPNSSKRTFMIGYSFQSL